MKSSPLKFFLPPLLCAALFGVGLFQPSRHVTAQAETATPTFDPLVETPLPPDPTELELGQNTYWHWCMTCHGDRGQGLTDEFRGIWEEDHQNCWARGCHAGRPGDLGFPIPTVVPAIVGDAHLSGFSSLQEFADFLKATHPPQSPGVLADEEYHAIALYVFSMNGISVDAVPTAAVTVPAPTKTLTPLPHVTEIPATSDASKSGPGFALIGGIVILALFTVFALLGRNRIQEKDVSGAKE